MADSNILRIGKISSINYPDGTARVSYEDKDGSTTSELPFLAWEYWMPKIGDQVLVGHLSNGSCAGVIIGPVWHGDYQPADGREGVYRKEYSNEPGTANETYYVKEIGIFATDPDEGEILYALAIAETDQWDYMPAFNDLLPSTITIDFLLEVSNATDVTIQMPNKQYAYDDTTGKKYIIGIDNGLIYFQEVVE